MNKRRRRPWIRNLEASLLYEAFLVSAILAVLGIRFFLRISGYPQLGGAHLHIAHLLWGGLFMMAAIIMQLGFVGRSARAVSAVLGGFGFGTFIDELGKFITKDNDYFYRPAVAAMYVVFVLLYVTIGRVQRRAHTEEEYLINALQQMEEVALGDLDGEERRRALRYLSRSESGNPLRQALERVLHSSALVPLARPWLGGRARNWGRDQYARLTSLPAFSKGIIVFFTVHIGIQIVHIVTVVFFRGTTFPSYIEIGLFDRMESLGPSDWLELGSSLLSGILAVPGVLSVRRNRPRAYRWFRRSILISILLTQVFQFYREQFVALIALLLNVLILIALDYIIEQERQRANAG